MKKLRSRDYKAMARKRLIGRYGTVNMWLPQNVWEAAFSTCCAGILRRILYPP